MRTEPTPFMVEIAIEPKSKADQEKLGVALGEMVGKDPSFAVHTDQESGQTIMKGMGELHLDSKVDMLRRVYQVEANIGAPQVAYRETITRRVEIEHTHARALGPRAEFARVKISFEPGEPGSGFVFKTASADGAVPREYVPGVEKGLEAAKEDGLLAGFPLIDFKATLLDGAFHDVDSSLRAFEIASRFALKQLREKGAPLLLEPIMKVEVLTPGEYVSDVIGDLNARRGQIQGNETRGDVQAVTALVPLANMFGYENTLRSFSQSRARFTMQYDHHDPVPLPDDDPPTFRPAIGMRA